MSLISIIIPDFSGGGAEKVMITLVNSFNSQGYNVDLVVFNKRGEFLCDVHHEINIVDLSSERALFSIYSLVRYINNKRPEVVLSALTHVNIISIIAKIFSKVDFKLVISEHAVVSTISNNAKGLREKLFPFFMRVFYRFSDEIVVVSNAVSNDVARITGLDSKKITTIYNPIDIERINNNVKKSYTIKKSNYQIIGIGRFSPEKDFITLIKAFYYVQKKIDACLVLLGEGDEYSKIKQCIQKYELDNSVSMRGFIERPEQYIKQSDVLCVSSISEGFGNVIVEALALGVPVVSTDCGGPREILEDGLYGKLVPIGDYKKMAQEIIQTITSCRGVPPITNLENRFGLSTISSKYLEVLIK